MDNQFETQFERLLGHRPTDKDRVKVLSKDFYALFNEVGEERFRMGVDSYIATSEGRFFPSIAELRGYIPKVGKHPYCGKCESGWIRVADYEARRLYKNDTATAMVRCECRRGPGFQDYEKRVIAWKQN